MDNYYIPDITEFRIGFDYMVDDESLTFNLESKYPLDILEDWIFTGKVKVKVKYLDQEDIESFGFEDYFDNEFRLFKGHLEYCLEVKDKVEIGVINNSVRGETYQTLFLGVIKNKSELEIILKQLNI